MRIADTPQTNEVITAIFDRDGCLGEHNAPEKLVVLARKLEREIATLSGISAQAVRHRGHVAGELALDKLAAFLSNISDEPTPARTTSTKQDNGHDTH